ncbi:hypothetical protein ACFFX0_33030 [Citricoccus parietis]|uniref:Uncharacterized protein n=1 Tax=Citricoccus parietis TaxID=592307 RepID=A0ABV5G9Z1_9MICC
MAASLMLKHSEGRVTARSAGLAPVGHLYEDAVAVMAEIGIPLDQAYPKPLSGMSTPPPSTWSPCPVATRWTSCPARTTASGTSPTSWDGPSRTSGPCETTSRRGCWN